MYISDLIRRLAPGARVTVLTGAGVSAASGVPTFRGAEGLWKQFRPEDLATPEAFARDPRTVWEWYDWRRGLVAGCRPNRAHEVLAAWSRRFSGFTLVTQNVDGLHEAAATERVVRLHGSIWHVRCSVPCREGASAWHDARVPLDSLPPRCPHCSGLLRPHIVWFGEALDPVYRGDQSSANGSERRGGFGNLGAGRARARSDRSGAAYLTRPAFPARRPPDIFHWRWGPTPSAN